MSEREEEMRLHELREKAAEYAKAKGQRVYLEQFRKSKKALLMAKAELEAPKACSSAAKQEVYAYAHPEYIEVLEGLQVATEIEARLFWELKLAEWKVEVWRTRQANERVERRGYGA